MNPNEHAAVAQIAAVLAEALTGTNIDQSADLFGLVSRKSNKADKIRDVVTELWVDGRRRSQASKFIATLTMEAHSRALQGKCVLLLEDVDRIVLAMKRLGLRVGGLATGSWRSGLQPKTQPSAANVLTQSDGGAAHSRRMPRIHLTALEHIQELSHTDVAPQLRGRQLELILLDILKAESLSPDHRITSPGEEIDLAFVMDGHHYLVESKWEKDPLGLAPVRVFRDKVLTKAEGTFGVILSMSGFVQDINEKVSRGAAPYARRRFPSSRSHSRPASAR